MQVFISHCTNDDHFVDQLVNALQPHGVKTWVDHHDMRLGTRWVKTLETELAESDIMLLILSPSALASPYVEAEWHVFFDLKKPIYPILIADCEVPLFLRTFNYIDFRDSDFFDEHVGELLTVIPDAYTVTSSFEAVQDDLITRSEAFVPELDEWSRDIRAIRTLAHRTLKRYTGRLTEGDLQLVFPFDEEVIRTNLNKGEILVIGRSVSAESNTPHIDLYLHERSQQVSRNHALLRRSDKGIEILDLNSTNGTYLAEKRLKPKKLYLLPNNAIVFISQRLPTLVRYQLK